MKTDCFCHFFDGSCWTNQNIKLLHIYWCTESTHLWSAPTPSSRLGGGSPSVPPPPTPSPVNASALKRSVSAITVSSRAGRNKFGCKWCEFLLNRLVAQLSGREKNGKKNPKPHFRFIFRENKNYRPSLPTAGDWSDVINANCLGWKFQRLGPSLKVNVCGDEAFQCLQVVFIHL